MKNLIEISLPRFISDKTLARNVYLSMPRNGKNILLAAAGDQMRPELLQRLVGRGVSHLLVSKLSPTDDADNCNLYLEAPDSRAVAEVAPSAELAQTADIAPRPAGQAEVASAPRKGSVNDTPPLQANTKKLEEELHGTEIPVEPADQVEELTFAGDIKAEEAETVGGQIETQEQDQRFSGNEEEQPTEKKIRAGASLPESLMRIAGKFSESGTESASEPSLASDSEESVISGLRETVQEILQVVGGEVAANPSESALSLQSELENCLASLEPSRGDTLEETLLEANRALDQVVNKLSRSSGSNIDEQTLSSDILDTIESARQRFTEASEKLKKARSFTGDSEEKFEKRFEAEIVSTPDQEVFHRDRAGPDHPDQPEWRRDRLEPTNDEAAEIFRGPASRDEAPSASEVPGAVAAVDHTTRLHNLAPERDDDHYSGNSRAAVYNDLPATAGRMAALLAHSIGYANAAYLSDLAFTTMAYFFRKEGKSFEDLPLPPLARAVLEAQNGDLDSSLSDTQEIIRLLETYFDNPECDRSSKEFSRRVFRETLEGLRGRPDSLNRWNEARWAQFVDKGPSIAAQSLCGKASACAVRLSRQLSI